eukprot:gene16467-22689_t
MSGRAQQPSKRDLYRFLLARHWPYPGSRQVSFCPRSRPPPCPVRALKSLVIKLRKQVKLPSALGGGTAANPVRALKYLVMELCNKSTSALGGAAAGPSRSSMLGHGAANKREHMEPDPIARFEALLKSAASWSWWTDGITRLIPKGHRILIYSQTSWKTGCTDGGGGFQRIDGSVPGAERSTPHRSLYNNPEANPRLPSLHQGQAAWHQPGHGRQPSSSTTVTEPSHDLQARMKDNKASEHFCEGLLKDHFSGIRMWRRQPWGAGSGSQQVTYRESARRRPPGESGTDEDQQRRDSSDQDGSAWACRDLAREPHLAGGGFKRTFVDEAPPLQAPAPLHDGPEFVVQTNDSPTTLPPPPALESYNTCCDGFCFRSPTDAYLGQPDPRFVWPSVPQRPAPPLQLPTDRTTQILSPTRIWNQLRMMGAANRPDAAQVYVYNRALWHQGDPAKRAAIPWTDSCYESLGMKPSRCRGRCTALALVFAQAADLASASPTLLSPAKPGEALALGWGVLDRGGGAQCGSPPASVSNGGLAQTGRPPSDLPGYYCMEMLEPKPMKMCMGQGGALRSPPAMHGGAQIAGFLAKQGTLDKGSQANEHLKCNAVAGVGTEAGEGQADSCLFRQ